MRVLMLFAHPLPDSFQAAIHAAALDGLRGAGHVVDDCDLYAENFNPVLSAEERRDYHDLARNRAIIGPYVERLERAEALVFCYPTWCFGMPAILKGWFDRVLIPGVSFTLENGIAKPALLHIRRVAGIATYGRPRWVAMAMRDPPRSVVTRYVGRITGGAKTSYHALYDMNRATLRQREAFLLSVRAAMARL